MCAKAKCAWRERKGSAIKLFRGNREVVSKERKRETSTNLLPSSSSLFALTRPSPGRFVGRADKHFFTLRAQNVAGRRGH